MARGLAQAPRWVWAAMAFSVAVIVVLGYMLSNRPPPPDTATPGLVLAGPEEPLRAAFLGDSYTAGDGASDPSLRWTTLAAIELGWLESNFGVGGSGYLNEGQGGTYGSRVDAIIAEAPQVVVVSGGGNDCGARGDVEAAARDVFDRLRTGLPEARLVVVTPTGLGDVPPCPRVDAAVRAAAFGLPLIDASQWLVDTRSLIGPDGVHPNDAGYAELARRFVETVPVVLP